jgi:hypothetical protein
VKWKLTSIRLELVLISMQYRCTVFEKCAIAQKSLRAHPTELLGDVGQVEARFDSFGDSVNLGIGARFGMNIP